MEAVPMMQRVIDATSGVINNVDEAQLANPTPCTEWSVMNLINHLVGGSTMFAVSAEQGSVPDDLLGQLLGGDNLGDDPKGAWAQSSARAMAAFQADGVMDKMVKLPFGEMPAGIALNIAIFDVATHACDIARATGQQITDTELLEGALMIGRQMVGPELRVPGLFDAEQPSSAGAPIADQLLAFAGRRL